MIKLSALPLLFLFLFSSFCFAASNLEVKSVKPIQTWQPNQIQNIVIQVELPTDYHAYTDSLKILNIAPEGFKSGEIRVSPEIEFYDKYTKKNRRGLNEKGTISILFEAPDKMPNDLKKFEFDLRYQVCSPKVCFLPTNEKIQVDIIDAKALLIEEPKLPEKTNSIFKNFEQILVGNLPLAFLLVFLAGVLTSFTPCIFPMLPITLSVLGHHAEERTRLQNLTRTTVYVLGIAMTYSTLGVIAAVSGNIFGAALTNKYVLFALCLLFFGMAFSMWGAFELQAPRFIRNRFSSGKSENNFEAFILGLVAGIVASPCVGPVLISILTFVSTTQNIFLGFSLLFVYACGLGLLFMVIGFFGEALRFLPRSGPWMNFVKFILGAFMWATALYYLKFTISNRWWVVAIALSFVALSIWKGAFNFKKKAALRQSILLVVFVSSFTVTLLSLVRPNYLNSILPTSNASEVSNLVQWVPYSEDEVQKAIANKQPILLDFYADWCGACHELEEKTYTHPEFIQLSAGFKLIKVDATNDNPQTEEILKKYGVQGLPTVLFINRKGDLLKQLTFTQFITWDELKPKMLESLK